MHRGLLYWPKNGAVYATDADYVCPSSTGSRGENLDNKTPSLRWTHVPMCCVAVGRNSCECWLSGCMQDNTRQKDSYIGHPLPFLWHESSPRVTGYFLQYTKPYVNTSTKKVIEEKKMQIWMQRPEASNEKSRQAVQEVLKNMLVELCKCQQTSLSWKRWSITLMWCVCKKQGNVQISHWCFKTSQSFRGIMAVAW